MLGRLAGSSWSLGTERRFCSGRLVAKYFALILEVYLIEKGKSGRTKEEQERKMMRRAEGIETRKRKHDLNN